MIVVHLKHGGSVEVPQGAAVTAGAFPSRTGDTPAAAFVIVTPTGEELAQFRVSEVAGYTVAADPAA